MRPSVGKNSFKNNPSRIYLLYVVIGICMSVLIFGLGYQQLIKIAEYKAAEERQNYRRILLPGPRGNIYDRNDKLLVGNRPLFSAVVYLNELRPEFRKEYINIVRERREIGLESDRYELNTTARKNIVQFYLNQINRIIDRKEIVESQDIEKHFRQSLLLPFTLVDDLSGEEYARLIDQIRIDSPIQIIANTARFYPYASAASHTLGFVSKSKDFSDKNLPGDALLTFRFDGKIGRSGIEYQFDEHLQGQTGGEIWTVDPSGFQYERVAYEEPVKGKNLKLTLDIDLQVVAEEAMGEKMGAVVAIEIESGEVLAIASKPNFDLNDLSPFLSYSTDQKIREAGGWLNRASQGLYPPGSTFKLITAFAGLREEIITEATQINCPGFFTVGRRVFKCHRHSGHGKETLDTAIRDSCNVFFYDRGIEMGVWPIADESRRFNLDQSTGIEIPGETTRMLIPDPEWKSERFYGESWFQGDTANMSIGQGFLLVTPLQMASFAASVARNVYYIKPTLVYDKNNLPDRLGPPIELPQEQIDLIKEGMRLAGERGTARLAGSPNMPVAGKTGTAQVRKDGKPTTLAWFVGYAPVSNPRIAISVIIEGVPAQETNYGGGSTAAPIAKKVFQEYLKID